MEISAEDRKEFVKELQEATREIMASVLVEEHRLCHDTYLNRVKMMMNPCADGKYESELEKKKWLHLMSPETREGRGYGVPIVVAKCQCDHREAEKSLMDMIQEGIQRMNPLNNDLKPYVAPTSSRQKRA